MSLTEYQNAIGRASDVLPRIGDDFISACLYIFIDAYRRMINESNFNLNDKETKFSAILIGYMRKIRDEENIALRIDPENALYNEEILEGDLDPDRAPIIDIRISGGWVKEDVYFAIEAKILVETKWNNREAIKLHKRYIDTGIDNFVNGRYASLMNKGCIAGYVIQGSIPNIVTKINEILISSNRNSEIITNLHSINGYDFFYESRHQKRSNNEFILIKHIFLNYN